MGSKRERQRHHGLIAAAFLMLAIAYSAQSAAARQICARAPYPIYLAYVVYNGSIGAWEMSGWFHLMPGACRRIPGAGRYYYFAEADRSDMVAKHYARTKTVWGGKESRKNDVRLCASPRRMQNRDSKNCKSGDRNLMFREKTESANLVDNTLAESTGLTIDSNAAAAAGYRDLQGRAIYGRAIRNDPKGAPFRIGIEADTDAHGVYVTDVYAGMPAHGLAAPGDRVAMVADVPVYTAADLIFAIQNFALADPDHRSVSMGLYRWHNGTDGPSAIKIDLPLSYYPHLDPERTAKTGQDATVEGFKKGLSAGTARYVECGLKGAWDIITNVPDHRRDQNCLNRAREREKRIYEMHGDAVDDADFVGSVVTAKPFIGFLKRGARRGVVRRMAAGALDGASMAAISTWAWSDALGDLPPPAIMDKVLSGAATGAATSAIRK